MKSSKMNCPTRDLASCFADGGPFARSLGLQRVARETASALMAVTSALLLAMPLVAQAGVPGVVGEVTNLTNNLVSYSAGAPLQPAYAAFDVRFTNTSSAAIGSAFLRIHATTVAQTSTNAPLIVNPPGAPPRRVFRTAVMRQVQLLSVNSRLIEQVPRAQPSSFA